jgi:transposase InsO family protein
VIHTPLRAPQANAYSERFVRTIRTECLDHLLIVGRSQLERVPRIYIQHYNRARPHRGLGLSSPQPTDNGRPLTVGDIDIHRRDRLGGLIRA